MSAPPRLPMPHSSSEDLRQLSDSQLIDFVNSVIPSPLGSPNIGPEQREDLPTVSASSTISSTAASEWEAAESTWQMESRNYLRSRSLEVLPRIEQESSAEFGTGRANSAESLAQGPHRSGSISSTSNTVEYHSRHHSVYARGLGRNATRNSERHQAGFGGG